MVEQPDAKEQQVKVESETAAKEGKAKKKWLNRFVSFLIMGGWLLILFLGVALTIVFSIVFKCK